MTGAPFSKLICPKCKGENIAPKGKMWYCSDCKEYFEQAMTPAPEEPMAMHYEEDKDANKQ